MYITKFPSKIRSLNRQQRVKYNFQTQSEKNLFSSDPFKYYFKLEILTSNYKKDNLRHDIMNIIEFYQKLNVLGTLTIRIVCNFLIAIQNYLPFFIELIIIIIKKQHNNINVP